MKRFRNRERRCTIFNFSNSNIKNPKFQIKPGVWDFFVFKKYGHELHEFPRIKFVLICVISGKKINPRYENNGNFHVLFASEHFGENENNNRNNKNYEKYPESHSGFKNVSNNFAACK